VEVNKNGGSHTLTTKALCAKFDVLYITPLSPFFGVIINTVYMITILAPRRHQFEKTKKADCDMVR
jgi:hypothetical protein